MNYATIKNCDIANGPGVRVSLFVSGCTHRCKGCFNEIAWDFNYGEPFTEETIHTILDMLRPGYVRGLTLLGGEPFEPQNQGAVVKLLRRIKAEMPEKSICPIEIYMSIPVKISDTTRGVLCVFLSFGSFCSVLSFSFSTSFSLRRDAVKPAFCIFATIFDSSQRALS